MSRLHRAKINVDRLESSKAFSRAFAKSLHKNAGRTTKGPPRESSMCRPELLKRGTAALKSQTPPSSRRELQERGLSSAKRKRLFLSGKAALVHTNARPVETGKRGAKDEDQQASFSDMLREVESFGILKPNLTLKSLSRLNQLLPLA